MIDSHLSLGQKKSPFSKWDLTIQLLPLAILIIILDRTKINLRRFLSYNYFYNIVLTIQFFLCFFNYYLLCSHHSSVYIMTKVELFLQYSINNAIFSMFFFKLLFIMYFYPTPVITPLFTL